MLLIIYKDSLGLSSFTEYTDASRVMKDISKYRLLPYHVILVL